MNSVPYIAGINDNSIFSIDCKEPFSEKTVKDSTDVRSLIFSHKGNYLAYRTSNKTEILQCSNWSVIKSINISAKEMAFSPLDTFFIIWEPYVINKEFPQGKPNLHVYKTKDEEFLLSFKQKNQDGWEPKWSSDETLFVLQVNSQLLIYQECQFDKSECIVKIDKLKCFSISPNSSLDFYFSTFSLGKGSEPAVWRIYKYPKVKKDATTAEAILNRSLFQADKATFYWNLKGTNVLTILQTDVDKTGGSYYGKQSLFYGDVSGNVRNIVFSKEGPIHAVSWNPGNSKEWVAVYGHAPAKATIFNTDCVPLYEFGTGAWNAIYFPPVGNIVLFGGFGNIASGHIEVWDVRSYKKLGSCVATDTTYLQWDPRGEAFITATTYPKLRQDNGYKIWHYTGVLMHKCQYKDKEYLRAITWQPGVFPKSELSKMVPKGIEAAPYKPAAAYRPPGARDRPSTFKMHEHEKPHRPGESANATPSKQAIKQKEKREARKARRADERAVSDDTAPPPAATPREPFVSTGNPDLDKKIKNINKKLSDIAKLKQQKAAGKQLELNQLAKIDAESTLLQELAQLKL